MIKFEKFRAKPQKNFVLECQNSLLQVQFFKVVSDGISEMVKLEEYGVAKNQSKGITLLDTKRLPFPEIPEELYELEKDTYPILPIEKEGYMLFEYGTTGLNFEITIFSYELEETETTFIMKAKEVNDQKLKNELVKNGGTPLKDEFFQNFYDIYDGRVEAFNEGYIDEEPFAHDLLSKIILAANTKFQETYYYDYELYYYEKSYPYDCPSKGDYCNVGIIFNADIKHLSVYWWFHTEKLYYIDENGTIFNFLPKYNVNIKDFPTIFQVLDNRYFFVLDTIEIVHDLQLDFSIKSKIVYKYPDDKLELEEKYPKFCEFVKHLKIADKHWGILDPP